MTREQTIVPLRWPGAHVIEAARAALGKGRPVDIELPLEMHYALFMHLHPGASRGSVEPFETSGGEEVLARIATVAGLEGIEQLAPALKRARYRVRLTSPEPTLSLMPPSRTAAVEPASKCARQ